MFAIRMSDNQSGKHQQQLDLIKQAVLIVLPPILIAGSVVVIAEFGLLVLFFWVVFLSFAAILVFTDEVEKLVSQFEGDEDRLTDIADSDEQNRELREFVYLDSLTVQSLLASLQIATLERIREVSERTEEDIQNLGLHGNLGIEGIGNIGGGVDLSESETGRELLETKKRIGDQYIFDQLYSELDKRDQINELPEYWQNRPEDYNLDSESLDIVKFEGTAQTDPLYRMMNIISLLFRGFSLLRAEGRGNGDEMPDIDQQKIEEVRQAVYGNQIGLKFDINDDFKYVMSLDEENLWVENPRREFTSSRDYTVLGRVVDRVPDDEQWDYIDIFRATGTVLETESMDSIRGSIYSFVDVLDGFEREIPIPSFGTVDFEAVSKEEGLDEEKIRINIKDKEMSVDGPAIIVDPIAIYW